MKFPYLFFLAAGIITVASGILHEKIPNAIRNNPKIQAAGELLKELPRKFNNWEAVEDLDVDQGVLDELQCKNYLLQNYVNTNTGELIELGLILGPPGPTALHLPEICYGSKYYKQIGKRKPKAIVSKDDTSHSLWLVEFQSTRVDKLFTRVYYGWNDGGGWDPSDNPFWKYSNMPYLYKIQVSCEHGSSEPTNVINDPAKRFLQDFLPVVEKYIKKE